MSMDELYRLKGVVGKRKRKKRSLRTRVVVKMYVDLVDRSSPLSLVFVTRSCS